MKLNCLTCKFVKSHAVNIKDRIVECRRYPPTVMMSPQANPLTQQMEVAGMTIFPRVDESVNCGEYKTKLLKS